MKTATVIIAGKALGKVVNRAVKYLKDEASGNYALLEPVEISVSGAGAGGVNWRNDVLEIESENADTVTFRVMPFPASAGHWNGPSVVADFDDGRIEASLIHDLIWEWAHEIAAANGMTDEEVRTWSNLHLAVMWREYGKRHGAWGWAVRFKSWLAANVCGIMAGLDGETDPTVILRILAKASQAQAHAQTLQMLISELRRHDGDNAWERIPTEVP